MGHANIVTLKKKEKKKGPSISKKQPSSVTFTEHYSTWSSICWGLCALMSIYGSRTVYVGLTQNKLRAHCNEGTCQPRQQCDSLNVFFNSFHNNGGLWQRGGGGRYIRFWLHTKVVMWDLLEKKNITKLLQLPGIYHPRSEHDENGSISRRQTDTDDGNVYSMFPYVDTWVTVSLCANIGNDWCVTIYCFIISTCYVAVLMYRRYGYVIIWGIWLHNFE